MKRSFIAFGFAISTALAGLHAHEATAGEGFYAGVHGGANWLSPFEVDLTSSVLTGNLETKNSTGYAVGGSAGYEWKSGFRIEGELTHRSNSINSFTASVTVAGLTGSGSSDAEGTISSLAFMVNGYYGTDIMENLSLYAGGGVGGARVKVDGFQAVGATSSISDSKTVFAFQAIAGTAYMLSSNVSVGVEYRFFGTLGTEYSSTLSGINYTVSTKGLRNHSVMVNLKYYFGSIN
ncbi:MAG: outer membrane beta-barrel protein [Alphaproteobacteria bacterium]|nr:outer membrane beta-barrel protein [Alphaproteobacteria bacterium]